MVAVRAAEARATVDEVAKLTIQRPGAPLGTGLRC